MLFSRALDFLVITTVHDFSCCCSFFFTFHLRYLPDFQFLWVNSILFSFLFCWGGGGVLCWDFREMYKSNNTSVYCLHSNVSAFVLLSSKVMRQTDRQTDGADTYMHTYMRIYLCIWFTFSTLSTTRSVDAIRFDSTWLLFSFISHFSMFMTMWWRFEYVHYTEKIKLCF